MRRFILATSVCILGGAAVLFGLGLAWVYLIQPDFEEATDNTLPHWMRNVFTFVFVFCAVHFSSYLSPAGSRGRSAFISGLTLTLLFCGCIAYFFRPFPTYMLMPVVRDFIPIGGAAFVSWRLHEMNGT